MGGVIRLEAGALICDAWTDDNRETGYAGAEYASWRVWARDRASLLRIIGGGSRRGIMSDAIVEIDGERI